MESPGIVKQLRFFPAQVDVKGPQSRIWSFNIERSYGPAVPVVLAVFWARLSPHSTFHSPVSFKSGRGYAKEHRGQEE